MITTLLLEPYQLPKLIPLFVTILRGPRRMSFSRQLRKHYQDFAPRLWAILQRLGYKKFLQRIYIDIDSNVAISHQYYELPILLAVLVELKLLPISNAAFALGKISLEQNIFIPEQLVSGINELFNYKLISQERNLPLLKVLNNVGTQTEKLPTIKLTIHSSKLEITTEVKAQPIQSLFKILLPGLLFLNGYLQLETAQLSLLQKIEPAFLEQLPLLWGDLQNLPNEKQFHWLALNREHLYLTVLTTTAQKKERENFFSSLFS